MRAILCCAMIICSLTLVSLHPLDDSSSAIQHVESKQSSQQRELVRDKRTIGVLRDLFPNFSQIIDRKIQMLTRIIFRLVGRLVLGGGGGGGGGGDSSSDDRKVSITLPTYPPSEDDEDEDEDEEDSTPAASSDSQSSASQPATTTVQSDDDNKVEESKSRKKRQVDAESKAEAGADTNEVSDESSLEDDEDRDKRFLNFNGGATATASASGNAAGSGNFLFDVIRRSADRAARMAGTVYRVLAGTDDLGLATFHASPRLVAGSGNNEETDEAANTPLEGAGSENHEHSKGYDGLGVPGPLTRLFVIANRGVASLIQDLILRLAQTSEKLVNFKARLITSII